MSKTISQAVTPDGGIIYYPATFDSLAKESIYSIFLTMSHKNSIAYLCATTSDGIKFIKSGSILDIGKLYEDIQSEFSFPIAYRAYAISSPCLLYPEMSCPILFPPRKLNQSKS